jgi:hypothetical protein
MTLLALPEAENMSTTYVREKKKQFGKEVRAFGEFASGDYVKRTEALKESADNPHGRIPRNANIIYSGFYIDSTLVGQMGKNSCKPLTLTILNFKRADLSDRRCRRVRTETNICR